MNNVTNPPLFKQERELTDESLGSEREKTDQSLEVKQNKTERKTDERVKNDRQESDDARAQGRLESDLRTNESAGPNKKNNQESANRLNEERHHEDDTVDKERSQMDAVIREERKQKAILLNISMTKEREETDQSLSLERKQVDIEVEKSSIKFDIEQTSHSETKVALTSRDEFLAIVSHDLRNPIGAIQSAAEHLLGTPAADITETEMAYWLQFIKRNSAKSLRLISDILDMERIAEGKLQLEKCQCNLEELIADSIQSFVHESEEKSIKLERIASNISLNIICDRDRIGQVLINLIGNAIKFTPEEGHVSLAVQRVNNFLQISISDNGPGIADEEKTRIFDRLAQINNKDRRGLGLGLYISKMLVEAHKGNLTVTSTLGKGSTFIISLPA